jgi:protoheme IX farnesyltransferase
VFFVSLWYLPVVLGLMMIHKNAASWLGIKQDEEDDAERIEARTDGKLAL